MCRDGEWHCQQNFRNIYCYSPHKRRSEIEADGKYSFKKKSCEHGVRGQFDYLMTLNPNYVEKPPMSQDEILRMALL